MKVKVKSPFLDANGLHKTGDEVEVNKFNPATMELIENETKVEKAVAKTPRKTKRKKV